MTSRFGKRNRSSSKLLDQGGYSPNPGEQSRKIKELEKLLGEKDKTIAGLEEKVKALSYELEHRKEFTDVLTSERNALRQKNASLVGKLAELSRKQSVSSFTTLPSPPELPKR
jgi:chromosome segregation ATPase